MLKYIERIFGPQPYEIPLRNSTDPRVKKLLAFISAIRFLVFPISLSIYALAFTMEVLITIFAVLSRFLHFLFQWINDSMWIKTTWFGIEEKDLDNEIEKLASDAFLKEFKASNDGAFQVKVTAEEPNEEP